MTNVSIRFFFFTILIPKQFFLLIFNTKASVCARWSTAFLKWFDRMLQYVFLLLFHFIFHILRHANGRRKPPFDIFSWSRLFSSLFFCFFVFIEIFCLRPMHRSEHTYALKPPAMMFCFIRSYAIAIFRLKLSYVTRYVLAFVTTLSIVKNCSRNAIFQFEANVTTAIMRIQRGMKTMTMTIVEASAVK